MRKFNNEKGVSLIEVLFAFSIFAVVFSQVSAFLLNIEGRKSDIGEYETAKNFLFGAVEKERNRIISGDSALNTPSAETYTVNAVNFKVTVQKSLADFNIYSKKVGLYKIKATVQWKSKRLEVEKYVSEL